MSKELIFMNFANDLATLSKCKEKKVAAVITNEELTQVYSIGLNGGPSKGDNCLCVAGTKYSCIHAEVQALVKCTSTDSRKIMFVTLSPCRNCAALIVNSGFSRVYYLNTWKDTTGLDILRAARIRVHKVVCQ